MTLGGPLLLTCIMAPKQSTRPAGTAPGDRSRLIGPIVVKKDVDILALLTPLGSSSPFFVSTAHVSTESTRNRPEEHAQLFR